MFADAGYAPPCTSTGILAIGPAGCLYIARANNFLSGGALSIRFKVVAQRQMARCAGGGNHNDFAVGAW